MGLGESDHKPDIGSWYLGCVVLWGFRWRFRRRGDTKGHIMLGLDLYVYAYDELTDQTLPPHNSLLHVYGESGSHASLGPNPSNLFLTF